MRVPFLAIFATLLVLVCAPAALGAQVQEWILADQTLQSRTSAALKRYFAVVEPDSTRIRYLNRNAGIVPYRLRGLRTDNDTLGKLLSVSLGQLTVPDVSTLRIALGDDLYLALLLSRNDPRAARQSVVAGDPFGYDEWDTDRTGLISLERFVYRFRPEMAAFVAVGAPESNLFWWGDASIRAGITTPGWEVGVIAPYSAGATPVGFLRSRRLEPGLGASAMVRSGDFVGRARFTVVSDLALNSTTSSEERFVHTLSLQAVYTHTFESQLGRFYLGLGFGGEEFTKVAPNLLTGEPETFGHVLRLSPVADAIWTIPSGNVSVGLGVADLALRGSVDVRLIGDFSIGLRWAGNAVFRPVKSFEHPFVVFVTPRIRF